jgi:hypothetical protein
MESYSLTGSPRTKAALSDAWIELTIAKAFGLGDVGTTAHKKVQA